MKSESSDEYFMKQAIALAEKALRSGDFPVGCVLAYQGKVIASGYRTGTSGNETNEIDHAEMTALRNLYRLKEQISREAITLYCTLEPCLMCYGAILLSGIRKIVYAYEDVMGGIAHNRLDGLAPLYQVRIQVIPNVLRNESLSLFKSFFENPNNPYWRGSLLADYTLNTAFF